MLELLGIVSFLVCNILVVFVSIFKGCMWLLIIKEVVSFIATVSYTICIVKLYMKDKKCSYISYKLAGFTLNLAMFINSLDILA